MSSRRSLLCAAVSALVASPWMTARAHTMNDDTDPYLWLEDVQGDRALAWVRERNAETERQLQADPGYEARRKAILEVLDSRDRIRR